MPIVRSANGGVFAPPVLRRGGAPAAAGSRRRRSGGLSGHRHPRRQQRARPHLRARKPAADARLCRGEDGHQQGHARQLVHRLHRSLHDRRLGRQRQRRGDARRQRRQRRGAGLARAGRSRSMRSSRRVRRACRPASCASASPSTRAASRRATRSFSPAPSTPCRGRRRRSPARSASASPVRATAASSRSTPISRRLAQRITFEGERGLWVLDGKPLGSAERWRWAPWPGRHRLTCVGADRQPLQSVSFEVRGAGVKAGAANR